MTDYMTALPSTPLYLSAPRISLSLQFCYFSISATISHSPYTSNHTHTPHTSLLPVQPAANSSTATVTIGYTASVANSNTTALESRLTKSVTAISSYIRTHGYPGVTAQATTSSTFPPSFAPTIAPTMAPTLATGDAFYHVFCPY